MWNKFSIQIAESLILHSNTVFKHQDLVVRLVCVFSHTCVFVWVPVHQCTHACGWHRARIFMCSYSVSIINSRKLIQFIAFTYWPEPPFYREGLWLTGCVRKQGKKKKGRVEEGEGEGKKMETCLWENTSGRQDGDCSRIHTKSSPRLAAFVLKGQEKLKIWGFTGMNTFNHIEGLWYDMVCPQNGFSLLAGMIK